MATMLTRRSRRPQTSFLPHQPTHPNFPLAQIGFAGSRHLVPERLPSARQERPVTVRIIDLSIDAVENIRKISPTLKRVDMSELDLVTLNEDFVSDLSSIEKLNLAFNELTEDSFPATFKKLENLIELALHNNKLAKVPKVMRRLKTICRLQLGQNKLKTVEGLEKLKKLLVLILDDNEIETLTKEFFAGQKRLEILHCSNNRLKDLPPDVRHLRFLRNLDLSDNSLSVLPPELFVLPRLEVLNASNNRITRIPTINVKGRLNHQLSKIDLSENQLVKFPEHLVLMTEGLDLSKNNIKVIPSNKIKKLDWTTTLELDVCDNPLVSPPLDVCECGTKSIMQYFHEVKAELKIHQGIKVLAFGAQGAGKSSLIQTLVDQQSRLTTSDETTIGVDLYDLSLNVEEGNPLGKSLQISFWDFSGTPYFSYPNYFFNQQPSLIMIVFNMAEYNQSDFKQTIGSWLNWTIARTNQATVVPVGTHADKLSQAETQSVCDEVCKSLRAFEESHMQDIQREIRKIESKPQISPALSEQLKTYINLLKVKFTIFDRVVPVSSKTCEGTQELLGAIQAMAMDKNSFPNVLRAIPTFWGDVENYVEDRGYALEVPILKWEAYEEEITSRFGMRHLLQQITTFLHDTGKVLWFSSHPTLSRYVILRPSFLTDLLKTLFRQEFPEHDHNLEDGLKQCGISNLKFERWKKEAREEGILERNFVKCIWCQYISPEFNRPLLEVLSLLVEHFEIGYVPRLPAKPERPPSASSRTSSERLSKVSTRSERSSKSHHRKLSTATVKSDAGESEAEVQSSSKSERDEPPKIPKVVIPWLRQTTQPKTFPEEYEVLESYPRLAAVLRFPRYTPPGFFETMVVRAHHEKHNLSLLHHWDKGFYARHKENEMRLYLLRIDHDDGSACMRMEVRHENDVGADKVSDLWTVMLPYLRDVEDLLGNFAGARVERFMECPACRAMSFLGEWQTPKELQNSPCRQCDVCKSDVDTSYLIQPKERRTVEDFLLQKLQMKQSQMQATGRVHTRHVHLEKIPDEKEELEDEVFLQEAGDNERKISR